MNDFSELEADLRKLRPAPVSDELTRRIERALAEGSATAGVLPRPAKRENPWWTIGLGLTAIAALLVIGFTFFDEPTATPTVASVGSESSVVEKPPVAAAAGFQPVGLTQVVYSGRDEGLVFSPNEPQEPRRRVRYETREIMRWRDAQTGASVRVSYPAEQIVLTPASFQ